MQRRMIAAILKAYEVAKPHLAADVPDMAGVPLLVDFCLGDLRKLEGFIAEADANGPKCPRCGDAATYRTPDGTFWDGNAHYWRTNDGPAAVALKSEPHPGNEDGQYAPGSCAHCGQFHSSAACPPQPLT